MFSIISRIGTTDCRKSNCFGFIYQEKNIFSIITNLVCVCDQCDEFMMADPFKLLLNWFQQLYYPVLYL
jgi:hypothetical protein